MGCMTARRTKKAESEQVHLMIDEDLLSRVDSKAAELSAAQPGFRVTRSDVIRMALHRFVETRE